ncbi:MBOAT family protein [Bradyrhizobium tropiciagri]|uniref:MBOAT family O-acyltransferase n=1 Tax=Bradyrhizobium tropiciagri TaxID=312253 RepID=UPI001BA61E9C|nr:MBOAT family protein [Bradyrhizobium tropiciagri]MBR0900702.1 MBOAT family protein [Bradyrhizobium tropiciagri]
MSFVQAAFFAFLPITLISFHACARWPRLQNWVLLIASVTFYAWWDWRFTSWLLLSISIAYAAAIGIERSRWRGSILAAAVIALLGILAYFKYANFFIDSLAAMLRAAGVSVSLPTLKIILPIGISFYTFQAIAYMVDVYRKDIRAESDLVVFTTFKIFFPQLVAGPIERAAHLLPQIRKPSPVDQEMVDRAVWLMVLGYFMKIGIADVLAPHVELAFSANQPSGWWTLLGTYAFGLQIYGDFLGYSLIAKGVALLFGIDLIWNFNLPYWSTSIVEFWRRWHISLSRWLRDYLYIPLGGSRGSQTATIRNLMVTMLLGGLWHGASWTFVLWGGLHGFALALNHIMGSQPPARFIGKVMGWLVTMLVVFIGWFLFRIGSLQQGYAMLSTLSNMQWLPAHSDLAVTLTSATVGIAAMEYAQLRGGNFFVLSWNPWARAMLYAGLCGYTLLVAQHVETKFIYFQF